MTSVSLRRTGAEREALLCSLQFNILTNGERGDFGSTMYHSAQTDGTILWTVDEIRNVPQELLSSIESISFCQAIHRVDKWIEHPDYPNSAGILRGIDPPFGETVSVNPDGGVRSGSDTTVEYPQYTLTLDVD